GHWVTGFSRNRLWLLLCPRRPAGDDGYSKKIENHCHIVALHTVWYNFVRTQGPPSDAGQDTARFLHLFNFLEKADSIRRLHERAWMRCHACSTENSAGSSFCESCGVRLGVACLKCGHKNSPTAHFCGFCGASLGGAKGERKHATVMFVDIV